MNFLHIVNNGFANSILNFTYSLYSLTFCKPTWVCEIVCMLMLITNIRNGIYLLKNIHTKDGNFNFNNVEFNTLK